VEEPREVSKPYIAPPPNGAPVKSWNVKNPRGDFKQGSPANFMGPKKISLYPGLVKKKWIWKNQKLTGN